MNKKGLIISIIAIIVLLSSYFIFNKRLIESKTEKIKIGVIMPQTGFLANPGKNVIKGIELYINEFNKENPNHQVELIIEDSKSEPKTGVNALNKLISIDKVKIVIGDLGSPIFLAMAPIAEKNKVVMISPGASNPKVRDAGDYIFRDYTSDESDGKVMANFMLKDRAITECAVLFFNNDYGVGLNEAFINEFIKNGGNIKLNEAFDDNNLDFKNLALKLKNANIKSVYFVGSPKQNAYFLKNLKELNVKINVYGVLSFEDQEFISIAKGNFDSVTYSTPNFDTNSTASNVVSFVKNFNNRYNKLPDLMSALGYDVANILGNCLKTSNFNINNIKDELYKVKNFNGLTGNTSFDEKGDVEKDVLIKEIKGDGKIIIVKIFKN